MVGRFLFGMLSGGALVAGVFVLGAVLFPIAEVPVASTAPGPVAEAPEAPAGETAVSEAPEVEAPAIETTEAPVEAPVEATVEATVAETELALAEAAAPATGTGEPAPLPSDQAATDVLPAAPGVSAAEDPAEAPMETALADLPAEAPPATAGVEPAPSDDQPTAEASPTSDTAETAEAPATGPDVETLPSPDLTASDVTLAPEAEAVTPPTVAALDPDTAAETPPDAAAPADPAPEPALPEVADAPEPATEPSTEPAAEPAPAALAEAPAADPSAQPPVADPASEQPPLAEAVPEPTPGAMPVPEPGTVRLPGTPATDLPGDAAAPLPDPEVASLPEPAAEDPSGSTFEPAPGFDSADGVIVGRLPRVGDAAEPGAEAAAELAPADMRPLARFAAPFENPEGKPLLSVVLIDPGSDDLDRAALAALPFPVAMALDPLDPASAERAAIYRAGGKEVVMLATGIADGAQASDIEVAFQEMDRGLPEAVAVMDLAQAAFQSSRPLASLVVPVVGAQGRGLLTWDQGLNAADQVARRDDIPAAIIFRDFATGGSDRGAIRRLMDRAVFKAGQDGRVVLAGTATVDLVAALLEWTVEGRAATVVMAPVSAVLTVD